ncbi:uncharacterized protein LOC130501493 [Raphanus sativus]|uniref:Uncharacterized protein LOC130501493 n=1 Tax=Raphanus sativus TaxID=3726 RepID=A0A9W3CLJ6_RAPSA|nr:uncharacterized protein LOC130501493 [Raphanus sativus]
MENLDSPSRIIPPLSVLILRRRLPTRDRLRRWGEDVPTACVLCSDGIENHHHLFFESEYSSSIWQTFASQIWDNPPTDLHSAAAWILQQHQPPNANAIALIKLIFQSSIYLIWKERNARNFTVVSSPTHALDRLLRDRLLSIKPRPPPAEYLLRFFLLIYRPP